jgi:hypothetical protein
METGAPRGPGGPSSTFFTLMVGALGSPPAPRGPPLMFFYIDSRRYRISISVSQGAHHRCFLLLMVGDLKFTATTPHRGPIIDVS